MNTSYWSYIFSGSLYTNMSPELSYYRFAVMLLPLRSLVSAMSAVHQRHLQNPPNFSFTLSHTLLSRVLHNTTAIKG